MTSKFIHLHLHTKYSMLDGMCKFDDLIASAKKNNMTALAATDHGNMYGAVEFYTAMAHAGIKPIVGMEAYVVDSIKENQRRKNHLILLVKNEIGYKNLMKISSYAFTEGFYYKPTIDKAFLADHSEGIIALSACLQGEVPAKIINNDYEGAKTAAEQYLSIFGEGNFYLEMQNHGIEEEIVMNRGLKQIGKELSIPLVTTNDAHYINQDDAKAHEVLMCIQTGKTIHDENRMQYKTDELYFKNYDEMIKVFPEDKEAVERSFEIAEKCNFELPKPPNERPYYMPNYEIEGGKETYEEHFEKVAREIFAAKYTPEEKSTELIERFEHEVTIIKKMGYAGYLLIVRDIIEFARNSNIPVGPGRGSAAGSLICYIMGITNVDPIKYGLLFERFLNPDRISPPDIDIDFSDEERDKVIEFIVSKFGKDKVAQIITFQTLKPRQAIRDVGRVLNIPLRDVDLLAKKVPEVLNISLKEAIKDPDFSSFVNKNEMYEELVSYAFKIEGLLRQDSTHAAGVVIAPDDLLKFIPIGVPKDKTNGKTLNYMTQYPMESLEKIGLLKFDILGLRNLSVIKHTLEAIKQNTGEEVVLDNKNFDNPEVYKLLSSGDTHGVFQLESPGMRDLLTKIQPDCFEDIIAIISLFRPGPMKMIDEYIKRKKGIEKTEHDIKELEEILKDTHGIAVYQEQVMRIAVEIAGFTLAQADNLRRTMSKKKMKEMDKIRGQFINGAKAKGISEDKAEDLFEKLNQFSQYGFNKSHAAAYAVLSYQTAYLKTMHTGEYMAALMTSVMDRTEKVAFYIDDCRKNGIKVLRPDINFSDVGFKVEKNMIRYGFGAIKNVGISAAEEIMKKRKEEGDYKDIFDFTEKVSLRSVTTKTIEGLVKGGAFDGTLEHRAKLFATIPYAVKDAERVQQEKESGQFNLFENEPVEHMSPVVGEWSEDELLTYEKDVLGHYVSSHPLAKFEKLLSNVSQPISDMKDGKVNHNTNVIIGGIVHNVVKKFTDRGEKISFDLIDLSGKIRVLVNEKMVEGKRERFKDNIMIMVRGRFNQYEDFPFVSLESLITLEEAYEKLGKYLHIRIREVGLGEAVPQEIHNLLSRNKGEANVILHVISADKKDIELSLGESDRVKVTENLLSSIESIVGEENYWMSWQK